MARLKKEKQEESLVLRGRPFLVAPGKYIMVDKNYEENYIVAYQGEDILFDSRKSKTPFHLWFKAYKRSLIKNNR